MEKATIAIEGMHCGGCVRRVTAALGKVAGVKVASVDVGTARVEIDPAETSAADVLKALDEAGWKARVETAP